MVSETAASCEAQRLQRALDRSPVAYSYFDAGDRLRFWNRAYEDLNFRIQPLIREGAYFPDLLAELVILNQISIAGDYRIWIDQRLEARKCGSTAFRKLTDGRTFLVQERKDEVGGTLGFWIDISDLFRTGTLKSSGGSIRGGPSGLADPGLQDRIRNDLQAVLGCLELLELMATCADATQLIDNAMAAARSIGALLDRERGDDCARQTQ